MKRFRLRQEGQSALIIAGGLVALIALLAVVVDAGNAYAQRRQVQNAMDAGAQAGAIALAQGKTNGEVSTAIQKFVRSNGVSTSGIKSYYVVQDANGNSIVVRTYDTVEAYGLNNVTERISVGGNLLPVIGVQVEGDKQFPTFFAGVVGFSTMSANGMAAAYANKGACSAGGLFPIIVSESTFADEDGDGNPDIHYEQDEPTYTYRIWENKQTAPGNFGYLSWNGDPSVPTLVNNMLDPSRSGFWGVNDDVPGSTGTMASSNVRAALQQYVDSGTPVTIPIYDTVSGTGNNTTYNIKGFARFKIVAFNYQGQDKYIEGKFQEWVDPSAEGGCVNFGVVSVKVRPPIDVSRSLVGTIKLQKITTVSGFTQQDVHVPVDVVNVLDISGSMNAKFGSKKKLRAAKDALEAFNNHMQPSLGDKVALVTYPKITKGAKYSYNCQQHGSVGSYHWGQKRYDLTTNITAVNNTIEGLTADGGTPIADALRIGRETVLGTGHSPSSVAVIILASDGNTNMLLNGKWTGYSGTGTPPPCNQTAQQQVLDQANIAKGDTNPHDYKPDTIIFSIAVGTDFNPALMQAVATADTDPSKPHYFRATDDASMASIYEQISHRVQQIGDETCRVIASEAFAAGATVIVRNRDTGNTYTLQTTSNGEFIIPNADPGTYEIQSATVTIGGFTYNVFTDGLGGPPLGSNPTVVVDLGSGTYKTEVYLKTGDSISCSH